MNNLKGFTTPLWPIHYKPLPDELLSCWLVRLAHGHGLKVQTFCNLIFGKHRQIWNRDMDRLAPTWLIDELSLRTGTSVDLVRETTLHAYEGLLYRKFRMSGALPWILTLKMYHRKRKGYGLQFCPTCLAEDAIPYFRKSWRVAFNTVCIKHKTMMLDRCPQCAAAVAVHRLDIARSDAIEIGPLSFCHACGFDFRIALTAKFISYDSDTSDQLLTANRMLDDTCASDGDWDLGRYAVMHHLCRVMTARYKHVHLREFVSDQIGCQDILLTQGRISFEARPIHERHHMAQLAAWLLVDIDRRLELAWRDGSIRYNVLLKDFDNVPDWYWQIVGKFSNWRDRRSA